MKFNVTDSLLARPVTDNALGIAYRPPKGWQGVEQAYIDSARKIARERVGDGFQRHETPHAIYGDKATNSVFAVMRLDSFDVSDSSTSIKEYVRQIRTLDSSLDIKTAVFRTGDFRVHQVVAMSSHSVTMRMIFDNLEKKAPVFVWNFVSPRGNFPTTARYIESMVGSLQPLSSIH